MSSIANLWLIGYGKITSVTASGLKKSVNNKNVFSVESYLSTEKSPTSVLDNLITEHMLSRARTAVTANCDVIWKLGHD